MKCDRLLHVFVPVRPVVSAGEFLVFMRNVQRLEMVMKRPVFFEQEIVGAAIDTKRRDPAMINALDKGERIFRSFRRATCRRSARIPG